ncbi:hypothetical protein AUJ95_03810 [Candidatus Desantisbacteria bacterium CG2_30_40_21]|uniref:DUF104 domain-containing protein n=5 Tax=unclassified Candidatus Desantisiibacteriota TaxID=3106372 RepID=A0A2M7JDV1_9BACT|nr:MAG: hypothetical protein AUJ95_03810 [Candidatus Desantisbacteria bacterium CG2_30_40_21]PIP39996.1 MAG: hypothetical protein COX18_08165 [Candidatus Desantisbacteria bacterium CG23_combo_of_CG06-09_8_20_14_all_40_23]PIX17572.1 MAG: hypothetical protein COZ71_02685 [Candidatus Desantisbacteria bacterium CG_4_8_14_3_um_filter_40_12]PIY20370.1 MAG: hypothetical protein COZ13_01000 [Candidatus Desantisbacteria bacterium CG_4_10_14_3_um_filter_40_18]PJB29665.1 MAG: hypothetical protein CO110_04
MIVKGIYRGKSIELLEPVDAKQGMEVEVIFSNAAEISFIKSMHQEINRMNKGFALGGGHYYQRRDELHER